MLIDWFTVVAQVINFLVLVWLLKRFLYHPILDALDDREQRIAKTLTDAATTQKKAQQEQALFSQKNSEFEAQRHALMASATSEVATERQRLLEEARLSAEALSALRQENLQREQQKLNVELSRKTQQEVFAITRQMIAELADASLEEQIVKVFLSQLGKIDSQSNTALFNAISTSNTAIRLRSSFPLQESQKKQISNALQEHFKTTLDIDFETDAKIISGIELTVNGQKMAWSIAQYIDSLEKHVQQVEQQKPQKMSTNNG